MTSITIKIRTENAAFESPRYEVGRILKQLGRDLQDGATGDKRLMDFNGNPVGNYDEWGEETCTG